LGFSNPVNLKYFLKLLPCFSFLVTKAFVRQQYTFMRSLFYIICFSFFLVSCGGKNDKWTTHNVTEGGFSVGMYAPIEKTKKTEVTIFGKQERHFVSWKPSSVAIDKFKLFEVSYINCPASAIADSIQLNATLDKAIDLRKNDFSEVDVI